MEIRLAERNDVKKISYLIIKNTDKVIENNYSDLQNQTWKKRNTPTELLKSFNRRDIFCLYDQNRLLGTIALQENEVVGLYVAYSKRNRGFGKILLDFIEKYAREKKIPELVLTSTPSAEKFYQKQGYSVQEYVDLNIDGVIFRELMMRKKL